MKRCRSVSTMMPLRSCTGRKRRHSTTGAVGDSSSGSQAIERPWLRVIGGGVLLLAALASSQSACRPRRDMSTTSIDSASVRCARVVDSAVDARRDLLAAARIRRRYFFNFEVTEGATSSSVPDQRNDAGTAPTVQFIVDSTGAVDTSTVQVVAARGRNLSRGDVIAAVGGWRFHPARIANCPVSQLLQVYLP